MCRLRHAEQKHLLSLEPEQFLCQMFFLWVFFLTTSPFFLISLSHTKHSFFATSILSFPTLSLTFHHLFPLFKNFFFMMFIAPIIHTNVLLGGTKPNCCAFFPTVDCGLLMSRRMILDLGLIQYLKSIRPPRIPPPPKPLP